MSATSRLYTVQALPTGKVSIAQRPRGGDWLIDDIKMLAFDGVEILVSLLTPDEIAESDLTKEAEICQQQGIIYLSYPLRDLSTPLFSAKTFALLNQLKTSLVEGKHVAAHCYMGLGRSALIAASVLVLSGFSPKHACAQLSCVRGYTVPEMEAQRAWVEELPQRYKDFSRAPEET
ncbi:MAG: tyrosine protein phosphatase [Ktedonobacteraceae bacterium]